MPGQYVPLKETLRGFRMILNGECDDLPESAFLFAGTIDDVFALRTSRDVISSFTPISRRAAWPT